MLLKTLPGENKTLCYIALDHKNGIEDVIPNLAGHAETKIEVLVVVCEVVLLHLLDVRGKAGVV